MNEWISVKDRLPEIHSPDVLAYDGKNQFISGRWGVGNTVYFQTNNCGCCNSGMGEITHWMPLPKPPEEK